MNSNIKILVVDRDPKLYEDLREFFADQQVSVQYSSTGKEAMQQMNDQFDIVIMELKLPDMDGFQLLQHIQRYFQNIFVIIATSKASIDSAVKAIKRNAFHYMKKTKNINTLCKVIKRAIEQQKIEDQQKEKNSIIKRIDRRYKCYANHSPDIIYILDQKGNFIFVNETLINLTGFDKGNLIGKHYSQLVHFEDLENSKWRFNERRRGKRSTRGMRIRLKRSLVPEKPGNYVENVFCGRVNASGVYEMRGEGKQDFVGTYGVINDLSEYNSVSYLLNGAENVYRSLFEGSRDGIFISTPEGKFLDINPIALEMFGYTSKSEILDTNIEEQLYYRKEDRKKFINRIERNGFVKDYELEVKRKNGKRIIAQETTSVIKDKNDNIVGYLGIIRDITEKKALEEKLIQAQKMEDLGKLAGGVVHDLNNVLSAISNYPDLILKNLPSDDSFKFIRDKLIKIKKSGLKAAAIAQDLLAIAHRGKVVMEMVDLNQLISEYFESPVYDKLISNNPNFTIKTDLDPNLFMIEGSPIHLSKIIMNLVSNAVEAIRCKGTVFVTTRNECLAREIEINGFKLKSGKYVVLQVADNGDGIEEDEIQQIFEPFYTKKEMGRSGTGLGMTIVWGTVQDHNGGIDIWTRKGQGTIFDIYLPIKNVNSLGEKYKIENKETNGGKGNADC